MRKLKLFFACLLMTVLSIGQVWATGTCTLTSAQIKAGSGSTSYGSCSATDGCSKTWNAYAIKNQHSNATSDYHFWQIKKYASGTAYYVQVPEMAGNITQLKITVSGSSKARDGGNNTATLFFSNSNSTSAAGTGVASGTGASEVTIDCSSLNLATGYITAGGAVRIWDVEVTYQDGGSDPTLSLDPSSKEFEATENSAQVIALTASNFSSAVSSVTCTFYSEATCATSISRPDWVNEPIVNGTKTQVSVNVADNDGAARQTWMKITASDGSDEASAVFAISQKALVVDYATLPFSFTGGRADIENTNGMTQSGLNTDYTGVTTKLKFDGANDNVIIHFNAAPGTLSFDIKGNGFSGGTFKVQESADGDTYTDIYTYSADGTGVEVALSATARYVKFIYVTKSSGNIGLGNIAISEYVAPAAVATPVISGDDPFLTETEVSITCETAGATIYYTTDGSDPKDVGEEYTGSFVVSGATTTVRAIAKLGSDWSDFAINTFNKVTALTTMDEIFAAASTAGNYYITFSSSWVVTGVSTNGKNAYITDGTEGMILFNNSATSESPVGGLAVGNTLSGTVQRSLKLYNGAAELEGFTADGLTKGTTSLPAVQELNAEGIAALSGVNTGSLIKISGEATQDGTKYYVAGVQLYNSLSTAYTNPTAGKNYNCTGVYVQYNTTKEILPRSAADVELITSKELASISLSGTYPTTFEQDDAFSHAGMTVTAHYSDDSSEDVTASATFTGYNMSTTGEQTVTVHYTENATEVTQTYTINVSAATPTGDWELFEGTLSELVAGDYLIYGAFQDKNCVMLGQVPSSGRFGFEAATPDANGIISNPSGYAVWTLAKSGDYWTFYNAKAGKYAAGNGVNNKGQMIEDGTSDYALWSISDEFVITNKGNLADEKNATLRHNGTTTENYGFACYGASTGAQPVFYKPATPSYYITETLTGCTAADGNPTKVPQALTEDVVLKYNLSAGFAWPSAITVQVGSATLDPNNADYTWDTSVSPAELTIGQNVVNGDIAVTIVAQARELDNIAITQAPTKTAYFVGDFFNPAGLQIQLNYTSGDPETVVYNNDTKDDFSFSPNLETALAVTDETVEITYSTKSANQAISVTVPTPVAKTVVIIAEQGGNYYAMSNSVSSSSCAAIAVTKSGANLVVDTEEDKAAIQWLMTTTGNNVTLQDADNQYLSSAAGSGNLSKSVGEVNWTKTEDGGGYLIAIGDSRALLFRTTGIFKHYAKSNLTSTPDEYFRISEFFEVAAGAANIIVNSTPTTYDYQRDGLAIGSVGTLCIDHNVAAADIHGATFYQLAGMEGNRVAFDDVTEQLNAGEPYLFIATASTVGVVYGTETADSPAEVNGMIGTYTGTTVAITEANKRNILYIANNSVYNCANLVEAGSLTVPANRCYIDLGLNHTPVAQAPAAGHHRIVLGRDELTGIFDLNTSDAPRKQLINGTIYILRGEKMYDTTGRLVK